MCNHFYLKLFDMKSKESFILILFFVCNFYSSYNTQEIHGIRVIRSSSKTGSLSENLSEDVEDLPDFCTIDPNAGRQKRDTTFATNLNQSANFNDSLEVSHQNESEVNRDLVEYFLSLFSDEFKNCSHVEIEDECYQTLPNGSVYVPLYSRIFNNTDYFIGQNKELFICPVFFDDPNFRKFDDISARLSEIVLGISILCIIFHIIMFCLVRSLRNLPGYSLISLCISLLIAYICYYVANNKGEETECAYLGKMMYYFFLSSFFWMNILAYDVWRSLRLATVKLRLETAMWVRFAMYSLYSWGVPLLIFIVAFTVDKTGDVSLKYSLQFSPDTCWFDYKEALLLYFAMPFFILLGVNIFFFVSSFFMITGASMKTSENKGVLWSRFCTFLRLFLIMGLTWIFGVLATATQSTVLWYFYVAFNASQGILIFLSFTFNEKTKKAWRKTFKMRKFSGMPTQSSYNSHQMTNV